MKRLLKKDIKMMKDNGDVNGLINGLKAAKDYNTTRWIAEALGKLGVVEAFPHLAAIVLGDRIKLRAYAARALGKISDPAVTNYFFQPAPAGYNKGEPLIFALAMTYNVYSRPTRPNPCEEIKKLVPWISEVALQVDHPHRDKAIIALGLLQDSSTFGLLLSLLREEDRDVRIAAAVSLSHLEDIRAYVPLMRAYNEGDDQFKDSVVGDKDLIRYYDIRKETLSQDFLLQAVQDEDADVRLSSFIGLGLQGNPIATETLLYCLHHEQDPDIRSIAVDALAEIETPKACECFKIALASGEEEIICPVLVDISSYPDYEEHRKLEPEVISIFRDSTSEDICYCAIEALEGLGTPAALSVIEEKLEEKVKAGETGTKFFKELTRARDSMLTEQ